MDRTLAVDLRLEGAHAKRRSYALQDQKEEIEHEIGQELWWRELPGGKQSRVCLSREDVNLSNPDQWPELQAWQLDKLEAFHAAFAGRIKAIPVGEYDTEDEGV